MANLDIYLLGPTQVKLAGAYIEVKPRKALALLVYLVVTAERHSRDALATLLWPESSQRNARKSLRSRLSELNQALGEDWVEADRESVALRDGYWLDVAEFQKTLAGNAGNAQSLMKAVDLYRDDFMTGFTLPDCPEFDEWQFFQAESLRQSFATSLEELVKLFSDQEEFEEAVPYGRRWLALDPLHEPAHQALMRLYAQAGQQAAALRQYELCRKTLEEELGIEPGEETTILYEQIRSGKISEPLIAEPKITPHLPEFLLEKEVEEPQVQSLFVAREDELAQLNSCLEKVVLGQGRVQFVSGEAGAGKTTLASAFIRQAQRDYSDLLLGFGSCNAFTGSGDPYLPFRNVLRSLTGDIEELWLANTLARTEAQRQWHALPEAVQVLVDHSPDLIGSFLPAQQLLARAVAIEPGDADWLSKLQHLVKRNSASRWEVEQSQFFEQYGRFLQALAAHQPLLIILDDLQWVDNASANLLFHLGRHLEGSRILVLGLYRSDEIAAGRPGISGSLGRTHPMQKILNEFRRLFGNMTLNLDRANESGGRAFLDALLDSEPNRIGAGFRKRLFQRTAGQPLFSVEMLRAMQERGDLVRDADGRWVEGSTLNWNQLPGRIEGVIEERIERLESELKETLAVASVEGEDFTAQTVAQVREVAERELVRQLSRELDKKHRLVGEQGIERLGHLKVYHFRFRHSLFQQHLYNRLGEIEREVLHLQVGETLESLYGEHVDEIAPQLALHFAEARDAERAVNYSLRAGDKARSLYANEEAIGHYERALTFLRAQSDYERAARTLMKLGLTYHNAFAFRRARQAYQESFALRQQANEALPREQPEGAPHPLRVDWPYEPLTLDPALTYTPTTRAVVEQMFSGLVGYSLEMEIEPHLARTWDISDGGRKYVFQLRDDAVWSDGTPVTGQDFEYAWKRVLSPATGSKMASLLYDIKGAKAFNQGKLTDPGQVGVKAPGRLTLEVELEEPASYFMQVLANFITCPVPRHMVEKHGMAWAKPRNIVTNGPFRLESWQPGESIVLMRDFAHFGRSRGNVQRVELSLLADSSARLQKYESGELDVLLFGVHFSEEAFKHALRRHAGDITTWPLLSTAYIAFDVNRPPFDDRRIRHAFVLAINRETLVDMIIHHSDPWPATGGFVPPGMPGHSPEIGLPYDPQSARQLLAAAGFPGGKDFPRIRLVSDRFVESTGDYLQNEWRKNLGVRIDWEKVEYADLYETLDLRLHQIFRVAWTADYPDPDSFLRVSLQAMPQRLLGWRNEAYDQLVEKAKMVLNQEERLALFRQADRILIEEAPIMPLYHHRSKILIKPWIKSLPLSPSGTMYWKDVIIEPH